jgi:DNA-binding PadR family transcriptional regulator
MNSKPIRLTTTSYAVLGLLDLLGEASPYDLKQTLVHSIENFWPVPHTTFYDEPARLAKAGYLSESQETGGRRRRVYALTDSGRAALREWADSPDIAPQQMRDEGLLKIFAGADPRVVFAKRGEWHTVKLAELEGYLESLRATPQDPCRERWRGAELTLIAGVTYHRQMLATIEEFLAEDSPTASGYAIGTVDRDPAGIADGDSAVTADPDPSVTADCDPAITADPAPAGTADGPPAVTAGGDAVSG